MEARCRDDHRLACPVRDALEHAEPAQRIRRTALQCALRRPCRTRREDDRAAFVRGSRNLRALGVTHDEVVDRVVLHVAVAVGPCEHTRHVSRLERDGRELVVVHEDVCVFTSHDIPELRAREAGVEEQLVRAELGERARDVEDVAVVAAEHADGVAGADPDGAEAACERICATIDLGERQRSALVDERNSCDTIGCVRRKYNDRIADFERVLYGR